MKKVFKKYRAIPIGFLLTAVMISILSKAELILIPNDDILFSVSGFFVYAVFTSLAIHRYLKRGGTLVRVGGFFLSLIILALTIGYFTGETKDNPLMIFLLIGFWLVIFAQILHDFYRKYRVLVFGFYGIAALYFLYVRLLSGGFEQYEAVYKPLALGLFLIPIPIIATLWIFEQWKWAKTLKVEKSKAELALLKSQVNPHFFFNTLNNLYSLAVNNSDKTAEVILKLSEMMRHTIYEGQKDRVSLDEEVEYLKRYIELHQIRYQKEVDIRFNVPEANTLEVAPLLFIILLENAFKHGVESQTNDAFVHIDLEIEKTYIRCIIRNNFDAGSPGKDTGIGLENLKHRLELQYQNRYILSEETEGNIYTASLEIETA